VVLRKNLYKRVTVNTVIMLLLRSKKLYQAMYEVRKILVLVIKQDDMMKAKTGPIYLAIKKYESESDMTLTEKDE
jgi:hypothetical protein